MGQSNPGYGFVSFANEVDAYRFITRWQGATFSMFPGHKKRRTRAVRIRTMNGNTITNFDANVMPEMYNLDHGNTDQDSLYQQNLNYVDTASSTTSVSPNPQQHVDLANNLHSLLCELSLLRKHFSTDLIDDPPCH